VVTGGTLEYFITFMGPDAPIDAIGSKAEPLRLEIGNEIDEDPPKLPGREPPAACPHDCDR
jgi:hypothetical protein